MLTSAGEQFQRMRVEHGMQLEELSLKTGISVSRLRAIESGANEAWLEEAIHLARAYGMTVDDLAARILGWTRR